MIKLSVKGSTHKKKEHIGVLSLRDNGDGSIILVMKDRIYPDYSWNLLGIRSDGTFNRCKSLPDGIGLQVNDEGQIKESKE